MAKPNAIGIDLGTSFSCVGVFMNGRVEIIRNDHGNRKIPSYVAFTATGSIAGDAAKNQLAANANNTVFGTKHLIGRKFDDPVVQADMRTWPFTVIPAEDGRPKVQADYKGETVTFFPEEITAMAFNVTNNHQDVTIKVYEGERAMTKDNNCLGSFNLCGILTMPRIEVTFDIDAHGTLTVSAMAKGTGISQKIQIKNESGRLSKHEFERAVQSQKLMKAHEEIARLKVRSAMLAQPPMLVQVPENATVAQLLEAQEKIITTLKKKFET